MEIIGITQNKNSEGKTLTTLHVAEEFEAYYSAENRTCMGKKVSTVYVGDFDCSQLEIGMEIELLFGRAIPTKSGVFQPVKKIVIV